MICLDKVGRSWPNPLVRRVGIFLEVRGPIGSAICGGRGLTGRGSARLAPSYTLLGRHVPCPSRRSIDWSIRVSASSKVGGGERVRLQCADDEALIQHDVSQRTNQAERTQYDQKRFSVVTCSVLV